MISTVGDRDDAIRPHLHDADAITVVVPVVRQSVLDWLANDQHAFESANEVAKELGRRLPGAVVDAKPGEADVGLAVRDALATFPADEILIALRPDEEQSVVEAKAAADTPLGSFEGIPVRRLIVSAR